MEVFHLGWNDVLWDQGKVRVHIPKTQHHEGKEIRYVPIGDILPYLEAAFNEAEPGTDRVITRFSRSNSNLDKPFKTIVEAAGLVPWPKLFQNLRASCETEWLDSGLPAHVVANWMGHSVKVQNDSYAQVDDHHFERFNSVTEKGGTPGGTVEPRNAAKRPKVAHHKVRKNADNQCFSMRNTSYRVAVEGLEPPTRGL